MSQHYLDSDTKSYSFPEGGSSVVFATAAAYCAAEEEESVELLSTRSGYVNVSKVTQMVVLSFGYCSPLLTRHGQERQSSGEWCRII